MRFFKQALLILSFFLLAPWPAAFAYEMNGGQVGTGAVRIEVADAAKPSADVSGNAIGSFTPGDLFYIHADNYPAEVIAELSIVNAAELIRRYRYLILKVGVYYQDSTGQWQPAWGDDGALLPETYLTLHNGRVSFNLPPYAKYRITVEDGSFYTNSAAPGGGSASPQLYLAVN